MKCPLRGAMAIPLRRRLVVLAVAAILPLALLAGLGLYALAGHQTAQAEQVGLELSRSVANAVDAELQRSISVLETLATTRTVDWDDLAGFRERALRVTEQKMDWAGIVLADRGGTPLVDTRARTDVMVPLVDEDGSFERVVETGVPAVGSLARNAAGEWLFPVRVPVRRGGTVRYVLTAEVKPSAIRDVLVRQRVPDDWVISIVDSQGLRVARSRAHEENLGGRLSETAQQVVGGGGEEGFGLSYTLEGERIFTPYSRLESSGWAAVLGIPTALVDAAAYRSLAVYGGGVLLSIALATFGALWVGRSIARPIAELRAAAEALGRRQVPQLPQTPILEIREVGAALKAAEEELTRAEAEREELLGKERSARETAEAADRAKEEFMAVLSHELRTPLNAIYGWARLLQGGHVQDEALVRRAMDAIVRNADMQVKLIDDLLDLSRITTGKLRLEIRQVELSEVLQGALDAVRPAAAAKSIDIQTTIDPDVAPVAGDRARLQQVVWNLLANAVKFTPSGGRIELTLSQFGSHVEVGVSDSGQGIAADILPHVFERFRQADSSSTRTHSGLGLGLALVKHLIELHGGRVVASSAGEGKGATFTVSLPISSARIQADSVPRVHPGLFALEAMPTLVPLDGLRVLVVDDDADALALADAILTGAGAELRTTTSAATAFDTFCEWRPDVLVSDIEMPGQDGYVLIERIRRLGAGEGGATPAIALTAYRRPQDRARSITAGFTMHVPKPVDPGELTAIIAGVAGRSSQPRVS